MGQLKTSEVRLLILFSLTVLVLGSFFLYEWYSRELAEVQSAKVNLQAERMGLLNRKQQQNEYNQKRVWLNQFQPVAHDEFDAKEALDRVVSVQGINAAGLTLVSVPPEKEPRMEPYYWAFERRVIVEGGIQNIVQWLATLQSESSFRALTHLHIFPKKVKEPETLTCEVTVEQLYATEEMMNLNHVPVATFASSSPSDESTGAADDAMTPSAPGDPQAQPESEPTPAAPVVSPVQDDKPEVTRPRVRLPGPPTNRVVPPAANPGGNGQANAATGTAGGMLSNSTRRRVTRGAVPPPPMASDLAAEEQQAAEMGRDPVTVETGIERPEDYENGVSLDPAESPVIQIDEGATESAPGPRGTFDTIHEGGVAGEHWDENTPGAGGEEAEVGLEDLRESLNN